MTSMDLLEVFGSIRTSYILEAKKVSETKETKKYNHSDTHLMEEPLPFQTEKAPRYYQANYNKKQKKNGLKRFLVLSAAAGILLAVLAGRGTIAGWADFFETFLNRTENPYQYTQPIDSTKPHTETTQTEQTLPINQTEPNISEDALEKYEQILFEGGSFRVESIGKEFTLESYCAEIFSEGVRPSKYCYADLDQNGTAELILCLSEQNAELGSLVFQYKDRAATAYNFTERQMFELKKDGTFGYSGGIADTGYASLYFTGGSWKYKKICNVTEDYEGSNYFCNGEPASEDMYWECVNAQNAKEGAEWIDCP